MQNKLIDLNNHLFAQMERLNDEELSEEQLATELKRADGMTKVAEQIIKNGELAYKATVHADKYHYDEKRSMPQMLENKNAK